MRAYGVQYPGYGLEVHKGYGTASHMAAISRLGPCPIHRLTFAPLKHMYPARAEAARGGPLGKVPPAVGGEGAAAKEGNARKGATKGRAKRQ